MGIFDQKICQTGLISKGIHDTWVVITDRIYEGIDLSWLDPDLQPHRMITATDLEKDNINWLESWSMPLFAGMLQCI